ncbi:MAG: hypothetical protein H6620_05270 [Halobacteriovoraceae bacterium]|nr:hypothetical protein [Halobacteriovoraceae bacterium]
MANGFKNCHFYLDFEKDRGCWFDLKDSSDYFVKYGYKYCSTFENKNWEDGRSKWVTKTRDCLQDFIRKNKNMSCSDLENSAFDSHPGCYKEAGFCSLKTKWKASIVWTALDLDILLKPGKSIRQAFVLLGKCIKESELLKILSLYVSVSSVGKSAQDLQGKVYEVLDTDRLPDENFEKYIDYAQARLIKTGPETLMGQNDTVLYRGAIEKALRNSKDGGPLYITECFLNTQNVKDCGFYQMRRDDYLKVKKLSHELLNIRGNVLDEILNYKKSLINEK